jgi:D-alanyl-lipoteichoic acid acyltransferase DltB (MBOAT superfamily)
MNFISFPFLSIFFLAMFLRYLLGVGRARGKQKFFIFSLLMLNLVFYGWEVPEYVFLVLLSSGIDFCCGYLIYEYKKYKKYSGFFVTEILSLFGVIYNESEFTLSSLILPVGISFYTFQSMSYTIDIYRGKLKPERNFLNFFFYITFFPQLVAGPIIKSKDFLYQIERIRRYNFKSQSEGIYLLITGLFYKVCIADNLAVIVNTHWDQVASRGSRLDTIAMALFFTVQIYFDFKGYSLIARGLGYLLGFKIPQNFNKPFNAINFSEFWKRWHISLSSWLKEYFYFSLGGNRKGRSGAYLNIFLVMVLGGFWHGSSWNFVFWGTLHAFYLVVEKALGLNRLSGSVSTLVYRLLVQVFVIITFIPFRASDSAQTFKMFYNLIYGDMSYSVRHEYIVVLLVFITLLFSHLDLHFLKSRIDNFKFYKILERPLFLMSMKAALMGVLLVIIIGFHGGSSDFIYFKF